MSSLPDVHTPQPLKINRLWKFFPEMVYKEGEPDSPPLGSFIVRGDYKIERKERDVPVQRFLILKPEKGCTLPNHNEFAVEYPEGLIAPDCIMFERKGSAHRFRAQIISRNSGFSCCLLRLKNHLLPVREYVLYEEQVEGTWIPIEADGEALKP